MWIVIFFKSTFISIYSISLSLAPTPHPPPIALSLTLCLTLTLSLPLSLFNPHSHLPYRKSSASRYLRPRCGPIFSHPVGPTIFIPPIITMPMPSVGCSWASALHSPEVEYDDIKTMRGDLDGYAGTMCLSSCSMFINRHTHLSVGLGACRHLQRLLRGKPILRICCNSMHFTMGLVTSSSYSASLSTFLR